MRSPFFFLLVDSFFESSVELAGWLAVPESLPLVADCVAGWSLGALGLAPCTDSVFPVMGAPLFDVSAAAGADAGVTEVGVSSGTDEFGALVSVVAAGGCAGGFADEASLPDVGAAMISAPTEDPP